ncbi:hypothetical protein IJI72_00115 [Candidatus Saccharibacteria bacterium]|nr:hypothetical protein [Candidatus Saccharibacteria bacterium]
MSRRRSLGAFKKSGRKSLSPRVRALKTLDDQINAESELGRTIFGPVPAGHQREFFEHKKNLWIWHEAWTEFGELKTVTIRYEVHPSGVYKIINNSISAKLTGAELDNFRRATKKYLELIKTNLYSA